MKRHGFQTKATEWRTLAYEKIRFMSKSNQSERDDLVYRSEVDSFEVKKANKTISIVFGHQLSNSG